MQKKLSSCTAHLTEARRHQYFRKGLLLLPILAGTISLHADTVPLFSNFGAGQAFSLNPQAVGEVWVGNLNAAGDSGQIAADSFQVTQNGYFTDALLPLYQPPGAPTPPGEAHLATLLLDSDAGGVPGATIEQLSVPVASYDGTNVADFISALNPLLDAGTTYWLVATASVTSGASPTSQLLWAAADTTNDTSGNSLLCQDCGEDGFDWMPNEGGQAFEIDGEAVAATPDPATGLLGLIAAAPVLGIWLRRSRSRRTAVPRAAP